MTCFSFRLLQVSQMPHTFSIPFSDFSLAFRAQGIILYRLVFDISSKRQRATSGWSLFLIWSTLKIWVVEVWGVSFFFLIFPPLSVTSRFSESLSANHLSFKLRFSGLSFNSPKSKLRRIFRKPGVFRNEIQVLLSNFASHINISSFFFSFETSQEGYFWSLKANFSFSFPGLKRLSIWNLLHPFLSCWKVFVFVLINQQFFSFRKTQVELSWQLWWIFTAAAQSFNFTQIHSGEN